MPWALAIFSREPTTPVSLAPLQFQVFLKQINSSLVDSNMLVRCLGGRRGANFGLNL